MSSDARSGEHPRIARLLRRLRTSDALLVPNGDDAAVLRPDPRPVVVSVDAVVEGIHFRRAFAPLDVLARRAAVAALSDLAAMGAEPTALFVALVLPSALTDDELERIMDGIERAAEEVGAVVAGGNLSGGSTLSITTTVVGHAHGEPLTRSGARPGDGLYVTAPLGHAALGLELLLRGGGPSEAQPYRKAWLEPRAHFAEGRALAGEAHAGIDISDGLVQDLGHLCEAGDVGATLDLDAAIAADPPFDVMAQRLGVDPLRLRLAGGESYGLLFAASDSPPIAATRVGTVDAEPGIRLRHEGAVVPVASVVDSAGGFDHFRG